MIAVSPRQRQVGSLIATGLNNPEIAAELNIAVATVRWHRQLLMTKLGLRSAVDVTHYAISHGWVPVLGDKQQ